MTTSIPVSVVIPCFRCAPTIQRAVDSVAKQTVLPRELILVDDGNSDDTLLVLNELRSKYEDDWIKLVVLDRNLGAASARNAGREIASGDFVAFLDADDSWHPRKLEVQYQFMLSRPDIAVSGHGHTKVVGAPKYESVGDPRFHRLSALGILFKNPFITPSFMVRKDVPFHFLSGKRHMEDHLFLMQVSTSGLGVAKMNLPLAFIYKNLFGDAGLSEDFWAMQQGELRNYEILSNEKRISHAAALFLKGYSWLKFTRRLVIILIRRRHKLFCGW